MSLQTTIDLNQIYDKNLNFLIGSGASFGAIPTLALQIKNKDDTNATIETILTKFESNLPIYNLTLAYYFEKYIKPACLSLPKSNCDENAVFERYRTFLQNILEILNRKSYGRACCNIFTTNYDGFLEGAADNIIEHGVMQCFVNDGTLGFLKKILDISNYDVTLQRQSAFKRHIKDIPQINIIHLHGSIYWQNDGEQIVVDYINRTQTINLTGPPPNLLKGFSKLVEDKEKFVKDLDSLNIDENEQLELANFATEYQKIPIVNPTKWKFHETLFQEHYYQMLRYLSYELERPTTTLVTFGFSFSDEHIRRIVQRSLSNHTLMVYICCFNDAELAKMKVYFGKYPNVRYVRSTENLDFESFNKSVFMPHNQSINGPVC